MSGQDTKRYLWTFENVASIGSHPSQDEIFPFHTIDHVHSSPKTPALLVLPRTVAELEESGYTAETEEEPRATRQRATLSTTHDSYESCAGECEAALVIRGPASGDTRLPQRWKVHPDKYYFLHFPTSPRTGVTNLSC